MNHLVIYNPENKPGKADGGEFQREAMAYAEYHRERGDKVYLMTHHEATLDHAMTVDVVAIFCHGTPMWLGCGAVAKSPFSLAAWLCQFAAPMLNVCLYACSTGRETTSGKCYAQELHRSIMETGRACIVWAHTTAGHTTRNPNLVLFGTPDSKRHEVPRVVRPRLKKLLWGPTTARFDVPLCETMEELLEMVPK
jgi:hypothetical protein